MIHPFNPIICQNQSEFDGYVKQLESFGSLKQERLQLKKQANGTYILTTAAKPHGICDFFFFRWIRCFYKPKEERLVDITSFAVKFFNVNSGFLEHNPAAFKRISFVLQKGLRQTKDPLLKYQFKILSERIEIGDQNQNLAYQRQQAGIIANKTFFIRKEELESTTGKNKKKALKHAEEEAKKKLQHAQNKAEQIIANCKTAALNQKNQTIQDKESEIAKRKNATTAFMRNEIREYNKENDITIKPMLQIIAEANQKAKKDYEQAQAEIDQIYQGKDTVLKSKISQLKSTAIAIKKSLECYTKADLNTLVKCSDGYVLAPMYLFQNSDFCQAIHCTDEKLQWKENQEWRDKFPAAKQEFLRQNPTDKAELDYYVELDGVRKKPLELLIQYLTDDVKNKIFSRLTDLYYLAHYLGLHSLTQEIFEDIRLCWSSDNIIKFLNSNLSLPELILKQGYIYADEAYTKEFLAKVLDETVLLIGMELENCITVPPQVAQQAQSFVYQKLVVSIWKMLKSEAEALPTDLDAEIEYLGITFPVDMTLLLNVYKISNAINQSSFKALDDAIFRHAVSDATRENKCKLLSELVQIVNCYQFENQTLCDTIFSHLFHSWSLNEIDNNFFQMLIEDESYGELLSYLLQNPHLKNYDRFSFQIKTYLKPENLLTAFPTLFNAFQPSGKVPKRMVKMDIGSHPILHYIIFCLHHYLPSILTTEAFQALVEKGHFLYLIDLICHYHDVNLDLFLNIFEQRLLSPLNIVNLINVALVPFHAMEEGKEQLRGNDVVEAMLEFAAKHLDKLIENQQFNDFSHFALIQILAKSYLPLSEEDLFKAVLSWCLHSMTIDHKNTIMRLLNESFHIIPERSCDCPVFSSLLECTNLNLLSREFQNEIKKTWKIEFPSKTVYKYHVGNGIRSPYQFSITTIENKNGSQDVDIQWKVAQVHLEKVLATLSNQAMELHSPIVKIKDSKFQLILSFSENQSPMLFLKNISMSPSNSIQISVKGYANTHQEKHTLFYTTDDWKIKNTGKSKRLAQLPEFIDFLEISIPLKLTVQVLD